MLSLCKPSDFYTIMSITPSETTQNALKFGVRKEKMIAHPFVSRLGRVDAVRRANHAIRVQNLGFRV